MKYFLLTVLSFIGILSLTGCGGAAPNAINGKYYMAGDSNCKRYRMISDDRIMCLNSDGQKTGYRNAMSDQELQMYHYNQAEESASSQRLNETLQQTSNQMRQNAYDTQQFSNQMEQSNYQLQQQRQNRKTNYQLRQINNNLNGIRYGY